MLLETLQVFAVLAEAGSVKAAAARLGVARSTVRNRLDELEAMVGSPLFVRSPSGWRPTAAGEQILDRAVSLVSEAEALLTSVRDFRPEPQGLLRVLLPVGMPTRMVSAITGLALRRWPRLRIDLRVEPEPYAWRTLGADLVVSLSSEPPPAPWEVCLEFPAPGRLLANPQLLKARPLNDLADLTEHDLLMWTETADPMVKGPGGVTPRLTTNDIEVLHQAAVDGVGVALAPDGGMDLPALGAKELVEVPLALTPSHQTLRFIALARSLRPARVQVVVDAVVQLTRGVMGKSERAVAALAE